MPRNGSGVYSHPFPDVVEGTTIESAVFNGNTSDVEQDLNTPRPIVAGGTGASDAHQALINLHGEESNQGPVTNYDTFPFVSGSFYSLPGATNAPDNPAGTSAHYFTGICYTGAGTITLEARDQNDTRKVYARVLNSGVWGPWVLQAGTTADLDALYVNVAGDTMTGSLMLPGARFEGVGALTGTGVGLEAFSQTGTSYIQSFNRTASGYGPLSVYSSGVSFKNGPILADASVTSGYSGATGTYYFGNTDTKSLNFDGANFNMVGGALLLNSPFLYLSYAQAAGGQLNFGNAGTKYLQYDGSNFVMQGGPLYVKNAGGGNIGIIADGAANFNGSVSAVSGAFTAGGPGGGVNVQRTDASYQYILGYPSVRTWGMAILANGSLTFDDISAGAGRLVVDVNGYVKAGTGVQCKAGISGGYGTSVFNLMYAAGSTALWIDNTNFGNISVSDYRIKKDVIDLPGMWDIVKALRPIKYTQAQYTPQVEIVHRLKVAKEAREVEERAAKAEGREAKPAEQPQPMFPADDIERWGFIAHELQETLVPSASSGVKDDPNAIQSPNPFTVIAALTKALQEAMTRIEALEAAP